MDITVRKITHNDLSEVLRLVKELAVFEREPEAVTANLQDYENNFAEGLFDGHIAITAEGQTAGITIFYMTWSTWKGRMLYLEDFIVTEPMRKHGIGKLLFDKVIEEAIERNAVLMKWQVLDWNETAIRFYRKYNAAIESEWLNGKLFL